MNLRHYLRGLGIGMIVTAVILSVSFSGKGQALTDDEIRERAIELGMVDKDEVLLSEAEKLAEDVAIQAGSGRIDSENAMSDSAKDTISESSAGGTADSGVNYGADEELMTEPSEGDLEGNEDTVEFQSSDSSASGTGSAKSNTEADTDPSSESGKAGTSESSDKSSGSAGAAGSSTATDSSDSGKSNSAADDSKSGKSSSATDDSKSGKSGSATDDSKSGKASSATSDSDSGKPAGSGTSGNTDDTDSTASSTGGSSAGSGSSGSSASSAGSGSSGSSASTGSGKTGNTDDSDSEDAVSTAGSSGSTGTRKAATITIRSGADSLTVANDLERKGVIGSASAFDSYLCSKGYDRRLTTGTFNIPAGATDEEIAKIIMGY